MKAITATATRNPREITLTLKQLSISADKLGTICGYFLSWPVNPQNYSTVEWISPLELIEVQDNKIVLCRVLDLDYFVNLYFMRRVNVNRADKEHAVLTFVMGNREHAGKIGQSLVSVLNHDLDRGMKRPPLRAALHPAVYRECQDPSLLLYSIESKQENLKTVKPAAVTVSYGKRTPEILVRTLSG